VKHEKMFTSQREACSMHARALWYVSRGQVELRSETIAPPGEDELLVRALFGAVSRGTERLVHSGRVPATEHGRMRGPHMAGAFPFPVKYGYAVVGRVEAGPADWHERLVFCLHPHQTRFTVPQQEVLPVPENVSPHVAVLAANMETALNGVWDATPGPADRIAVVGGGLVGMLCAYLCGPLPGAEVTVIDVAPGRAELAHRLGLRFAAPGDAPVDRDLVFHASGTAAGLATALRLAGDEASIIDLSWYGSGDVAVPLGEAFHSRRLRLHSSQVGRVAPSHRSRWTRGERLSAALALLKDPLLEVLLSPPIKFDELPAQLPSIFAASFDHACPLIQYPST
jgi:NADPH:quinone reductase-like Zn-dependent oxidoreductase